MGGLLTGQPLVARRHQRQRVSVPVAVRCVAAGPGTVAGAVPVVAAVRVVTRSSGRVLVQQVGVGGGSSGPGGRRDLDLARAFHSLQREGRDAQAAAAAPGPKASVSPVLTTLAVLPQVLRI